MTKHCKPRGGAPVGVLADLDPLEANAVLYLRHWSDGTKGRRAISKELATLLGGPHGRAATEALNNLLELCRDYGRRPLMHHHTRCTCLGADEACFANFIAAAAEGERDDALLLATLLVRPDVAPMLASVAFEFGVLLRRATDRASIHPTTHPVETTLH